MDVNEAMKFFGKFNKKMGGGGSGVGLGGQGRCEQKKFCENSYIGGGGGGRG